jgi:DnaJ-class molecular chaperone
MALADQLQDLASAVRALEVEVESLRRENRRLKRQLSRPAPATTTGKPWEVLGLTQGADTAAVMLAFRNLSKRHHPDVPGGDRDLFEQVVAARDAMLRHK